MENSKMVANRFLKLQTVKNKAKFVNMHLDAGRTIYFYSYGSIVKFTPKKRDLLILKKDGFYYMAGKKLTFLGLCKIAAE